MILQQLVKDAERIVKKMPPTMYGPTPIKWIISLDAHGAFLECIPTVENEHTKKDKGQIKQAPILSRKRTSGITPQLLVDKPSYVFGIPADDKRAPKEAASFRALVNECYQATGEATVQAVAAFLTWWDAGEPSLSRLGLSEIGDNDLITFRIGGILPIDVPGVQQFWAAKSSASEGDSLGGALSQCLVCGRQTVIPKCLPVPIKGLHGGQASGIPLVSINAEAFESFNLHDGTTSRVCGDCGERFGKALNHLLAAEDGHLAVGPLVYVFWTRQGGGFAWATLLQQPQAGAVRELLASYRTGKPFTVADAEAFYATALSASGGRAVVRDWLQTTVGDAAAHLAQWFARLKQVDSFGQPGEPLGVYKLAASLYRDANKEMVAQVPRVLVRTALHGGHCPNGCSLRPSTAAGRSSASPIPARR